jgi:formylglycine-generating enzyme required for sulfatase activity
MRKRCLFSFLFLLMASVTVFSQNRIALVIGNSSYKTASLKNPVNDAMDMTKILKELGFGVTTLYNASYGEMFQAVRAFGSELSQARVGLFYFAGHGMQVKGRNYLIPVDADIQAEEEAAYTAIDAGLVLSKMERAGNRTNIVILDACRDNPFARSFRTSQRGLSVMDAPRGSLIVYATAPGSVAADGAGRNGIFTGAFLRHVGKPGIDVEIMLRNVRRDVMAATNNAQVPWSSSSLVESFYFVEIKEIVEKPEKTQIETEFGAIRVGVKSAGELFVDGVRTSRLSAGATTTLEGIETGTHELAMHYEEDYSESKKVTVEKSQTAVVAFTWVRPSTEQAVEQEMVLVEGGTFTMGSNREWEKPSHEVTLSSFYISRYEITFEEYDEFCRETARELPSDEGWGRGRRPVINVRWSDAIEYCNWRSQREGLKPCYRATSVGHSGSGGRLEFIPAGGAQESRAAVLCDFDANGYRLPTETEWEYAARGGTKSKGYNYSGSNSADLVGWHASNSENQTHEVGQKKPNELGLYDMSGNAWEWCWDWFGKYTQESQTNPKGPAKGRGKVRRGGNWSTSSGALRVANRSGVDLGVQPRFIGFRLTRTAGR